MKCVERFLKFLNKNAYIQAAIFGYSFCKAAKQAFFLILRNCMRLATLGVISTFMGTIGRVFVTVSGAGCC